MLSLIQHQKVVSQLLLTGTGIASIDSGMSTMAEGFGKVLRELRKERYVMGNKARFERVW